MKDIVIFSLVILLLAGCAGIPDETTTSVPWDDPSVESTVYQIPDAFDPDTAKKLTQEQLDWYQQLFSFQHDSFTYHDVNYYNVILELSFDTPEELDIRRFFNNGFADDRLLSAAEKQWLQEQGANTSYTWYGLSPERMDAVMQQYFGLSLSQTNGVGMDQLYYNQEWDRYFICPAGYVGAEEFTILEGYADANNVVQLTFEFPYSGVTVLTMASNSRSGTYGYRFLSHVKQHLDSEE